MKPNRTWFPVLAFLVLSVFPAPAVQAVGDCNNPMVCDCGNPCSTRCNPAPGSGLPTLTCGQWGYPCMGSSLCPNVSGDSDLLLIFSTPAPETPAPAAVSVNR
jgi:hypothetical protein